MEALWIEVQKTANYAMQRKLDAEPSRGFGQPFETAWPHKKTRREKGGFSEYNLFYRFLHETFCFLFQNILEILSIVSFLFRSSFSFLSGSRIFFFSSIPFLYTFQALGQGGFWIFVFLTLHALVRVCVTLSVHSKLSARSVVSAFRLCVANDFRIHLSF